jgi:hypothetical protein
MHAKSSSAKQAPITVDALFTGEKLSAPPVPADLAAAMLARGPIMLSTRSLEDSPYHLGPFLAEVAAQPDMPAYAVAGFAGHGLNSWAAHYYLVTEGLALFIQLPWGGAYLDAERARAEIADQFDWAAKLQSRLELAVQQKKIPPGSRLQVSMTRLARAGWRWLVPGRDNAATPWNPAGGMKDALLQLLDDVLSGKSVLHCCPKQVGDRGSGHPVM